MTNEVIPGLKVIHHSASGVDATDDPSFPFKLEGNFGPPNFLEVSFILMRGGSETFVIRAMNREALDKFIELNEYRTHPRLRRLIITGPDGVLEEIKGSR